MMEKEGKGLEHAYKITTHGRALIAACWDLERPLRACRVAVGSGLAPEGTDLARVHQLYRYVADGTVGERRHEGDRLYLSVQYDNSAHPEVGAFQLTEFIVYALDPETGGETDLLYATLGDYRQPVPAYRGYPASVFSYPMVLVVSGEIELEIDAAPGLATHADLIGVREGLLREIMMGELALPLTADTGEPLLTSSGRPIQAVYELDRSGGVLARAQARLEQAEIDMRAYTDARLREAVEAVPAAISAQIEAHDKDAAAHPTHLAAAGR